MGLRKPRILGGCWIVGMGAKIMIRGLIKVVIKAYKGAEPPVKLYIKISLFHLVFLALLIAIGATLLVSSIVEITDYQEKLKLMANAGVLLVTIGIMLFILEIGEFSKFLEQINR